MILPLRGIEADFGPVHADTFRNVQPPTFAPISSPPMTCAAALKPIEA
jgi:hypothetical protein